MTSIFLCKTPPTLSLVDKKKMSAAKAILIFFPGLNPKNSISPSSKFSTSKLVLSRKFISPKSVSWKNTAWSSSYSMTEPIKTRVFRDGSGDDGVSAFEQEAFIDGSSDFNPNHTAGGLESTLNRLSKWLLTALFGAFILWRHDAEALWAALGSILNSGLSVILKQTLNQERPVSTFRPVSTSTPDPGMPSSHAQVIFFTVIFSILSMVEWLGVNGLSTILIGLIIAVGSYLSWLRVLLRFHTFSQVAVGAVVGSVFSILWFWLWNAIVLKAFISYMWVRIVVVLGAVGFCLGFLLHVIRYWVMDAKETL